MQDWARQIGTGVHLLLKLIQIILIIALSFQAWGDNFKDSLVFRVGNQVVLRSDFKDYLDKGALPKCLIGNSLTMNALRIKTAIQSSDQIDQLLADSKKLEKLILYFKVETFVKQASKDEVIGLGNLRSKCPKSFRTKTKALNDFMKVESFLESRLKKDLKGQRRSWEQKVVKARELILSIGQKYGHEIYGR